MHLHNAPLRVHLHETVFLLVIHCDLIRLIVNIDMVFILCSRYPVLCTIFILIVPERDPAAVARLQLLCLIMLIRRAFQKSVFILRNAANDVRLLDISILEHQEHLIPLFRKKINSPSWSHVGHRHLCPLELVGVCIPHRDRDAEPPRHFLCIVFRHDPDHGSIDPLVTVLRLRDLSLCHRIEHIKKCHFSTPSIYQ